MSLHPVEPIGRRAGSTVILLAIATILSACGGGGESPSAVSSSPATSPANGDGGQAPDQTPVGATPVGNAPAVPPAPTTGGSSTPASGDATSGDPTAGDPTAGDSTSGGGIAPVPPAATAAPGGPSVSRSAIVKALVTSSDTVAVKQDQSLDLLAFLARDFSRVAQSLDGSRIRQVSTLTLATDTVDSAHTEQRQVTLSADVSTDASSTLTFGGSGSVTSPAGTYSISSAQVTLPDPVPLDQGLLQFNLPAAPGSSVKFFVGSIDGQPERMRVCWHFDLPGALRVACAHHDKASGNWLGADSIDDLGGTLYTHAANEGSSRQVSVLRCVARTFTAPDINDTGYPFAVIGFDSSQADGGLFPEKSEPYYETTVTPNADGSVDYRLLIAQLGAPDTTARVLEGRVASITSGGTGGSYNYSRQCDRPL